MYNKYFTMKKSELKEAIKAEITSILSEDINEIGFRPNTGLAQIKAQGEVDGADAITKELRQYNLKNVPDMDAYADGFVKGAASKAMFYKDKLDQAIRGGGDEESLMGLVGLKEEDEAPAGDKKTEKAARGADKAKNDYAKLAGKDNTEISKASSLVKEKAKKAKEGDKEALNWLKTNQPKIKAYNDLKK